MEWFKFFPKEIAALTDGMTLEDYAITLKLISRFAITNGRPIVDESLTILFPSCSDRAKAVLHLVFSPNNQGDGWIFEPLMDQVDAYRTRCEVNAKNRNSAKKPQIDGESSTDCERIVDESSTNRPKKKEERRKKIEDVSSGAVESSPAPQQQPSSSQETTKKKPLGGDSRTMPLSEAVDSLSESWRKYAEQVRPDLDPQTTYTDFRFYWTDGKGAGTRRTVRGWNTSWQNWVKNQKAPKPGTTPVAAPKVLTPEQKHEYKRTVAKAYGFPDKYLDAAAEGRYSVDSGEDLMSSVLQTKQGAA